MSLANQIVNVKLLSLNDDLSVDAEMNPISVKKNEV